MKKLFFLLMMTGLLTGLQAQESIPGQFDKLSLSGPMKVTVEVGPSASISMGEAGDAITWAVGEGALRITSKAEGDETPSLTLTVTELSAVAMSGAVILSVEHELMAEEFNLHADFQCIADLRLKAEKLNVHANHQSIINLTGEAEEFNLYLDQQSIFSGETLFCEEVNIKADHQSIATVNSTGAEI
ncbi:MAG: DUF2807 domain-containing protein, partial [Lewinella sp.]|nr:DUF2807 domain-containing protein [Lewinella sp.]